VIGADHKVFRLGVNRKHDEEALRDSFSTLPPLTLHPPALVKKLLALDRSISKTIVRFPEKVLKDEKPGNRGRIRRFSPLLLGLKNHY
jgi:hypothetical protein